MIQKNYTFSSLLMSSPVLRECSDTMYMGSRYCNRKGVRHHVTKAHMLYNPIGVLSQRDRPRGREPRECLAGHGEI